MGTVGTVGTVGSVGSVGTVGTRDTVTPSPHVTQFDVLKGKHM